MLLLENNVVVAGGGALGADEGDRMARELAREWCLWWCICGLQPLSAHANYPGVFVLISGRLHPLLLLTIALSVLSRTTPLLFPPPSRRNPLIPLPSLPSRAPSFSLLPSCYPSPLLPDLSWLEDH